MPEPTNGACMAASGASWSAYSLQGQGRSRNADAFAVYEGPTLRAFAVADGVGSLPGSPLASRAAVDAVVAAAESGMLPPAGTADELFALVNDSVAYALNDGAAAGATTLAVVIARDHGTTVLSVGDCEVHAVGEFGGSTLLNQLDHVPARPNVLLSWIDGKLDFEPHIDDVPPGPELLCLLSDGIPGVVSREDIARITRASATPDAARELVLAARRLGATDDVTAVVFKRIR